LLHQASSFKTTNRKTRLYSRNIQTFLASLLHAINFIFFANKKTLLPEHNIKLLRKKEEMCEYSTETYTKCGCVHIDTSQCVRAAKAKKECRLKELGWSTMDGYCDELCRMISAIKENSNIMDQIKKWEALSGESWGHLF